MKRNIFFLGTSNCTSLSFLYYRNKQFYGAIPDNWGGVNRISWSMTSTEEYDIYFVWKFPSGAKMIKEYTLDQMLEGIKHKIDSRSVIIPMWGEHEMRVHFPIHHNAKEIATKYVDTIVDYFLPMTNKILFMEPVPVVDSDRWVGADWIYAQEFNEAQETRSDYYEFINTLEEMTAKYMLPAPIRIINNVIKGEFVSEDETYDGGHLYPEVSIRLLNHVLGSLKDRFGYFSNDWNEE